MWCCKWLILRIKKREGNIWLVEIEILDDFNMQCVGFFRVKVVVEVNFVLYVFFIIKMNYFLVLVVICVMRLLIFFFLDKKILDV